MAQPRTSREKSDRDGRPCIHMVDEDGDLLQVHHRGDQTTGFTVSSSGMVDILPGVRAHQRMDVYLTQSQAQELCDYFRSVL